MCVFEAGNGNQCNVYADARFSASRCSSSGSPPSYLPLLSTLLTLDTVSQPQIAFNYVACCSRFYGPFADVSLLPRCQLLSMLLVLLLLLLLLWHVRVDDLCDWSTYLSGKLQLQLRLRSRHLNVVVASQHPLIPHPILPSSPSPLSCCLLRFYGFDFNHRFQH